MSKSATSSLYFSANFMNSSRLTLPSCVEKTTAVSSEQSAAARVCCLLGGTNTVLVCSLEDALGHFLALLLVRHGEPPHPLARVCCADAHALCALEHVADLAPVQLPVHRLVRQRKRRHQLVLCRAVLRDGREQVPFVNLLPHTAKQTKLSATKADVAMVKWSPQQTLILSSLSMSNTRHTSSPIFAMSRSSVSLHQNSRNFALVREGSPSLSRS